MAFWAWTDQAGKRQDRPWRRQVYIPTVKGLRDDHPMIKAVGMDAAIKICHLFSGATVEFPNGNSLMRDAAQKHARVLAEHGLSLSEIASEVAEFYPLADTVSIEWVRNALKNGGETKN